MTLNQGNLGLDLGAWWALLGFHQDMEGMLILNMRARELTCISYEMFSPTLRYRFTYYTVRTKVSARMLRPGMNWEFRNCD